MKQLTCEMCGSTDLIKQDGVFVCQTCGTKYSVEEAKKMMVEGTVEVTGTVRVDDSDAKKEQISNYLEMAKSALDGEDIEGVVSYCNRILEIDMDNYEAWVLKAKAAGWGSSLKDIKVPQALTAAKRAVNLAPDEKKYDVASEVYYAIKAQIVSLLTMAQRMELGISTRTGAAYVHKVMLQWKSILVGIPFLSKGLIEKEIRDCQSLREELIIASCYNNNHVFYDKMFRDALAEKIKLEESREESREQEFKEKSKAKKAAYWAEHAEEKAALDTEKSSLDGKLAELYKQLKTLPENTAVADLRNQISAKKKEKDGLGLLKGKEKKAIQEKIDELEKRLSEATKARDSAVSLLNESVGKVKARIAEIQAELRRTDNR